MPRMYSEKHGREHKARIITQQQEYRHEGESVLVTHDTPKGSPC
ncbi:hypothetical protein VT85_22615 [Planctomyces sp. SH-PL62]|nr:hypothetical protein VT85_22615 [Planctomyces sp. SH-PL62]